ncbi:MAG: phytanoyl-CoA dioxygenase family protein [Rhodospirillales bacterium]|nr:phytanoyl-CoA dioxygenase family protein [Rhodospirillales bacterium]MCB9996389.1 phytanoyl-CoA dioxygenase family protein [Rhodospirillales bacterium]
MKDFSVSFVVDAGRKDAVAAAVECLREQGVVCLRGITDPAAMEKVTDAVSSVLENPAMLGSTGYYMKDCHKKLHEAFLTSGDVMPLLLDERIIDVCETYMGEDVLLQEMLVKNDLGDNELYFPVHAHTGSYRTEKNPGPFSVGIMLYTHDTSAGAFCYAPGTHLWDIPYGADPADYPADMQEQIKTSMQRISGLKGDIVLFDHRGFHGPEQPVKVPRIVFLGGFHSAKSHAYKMKAPTAAYIHDLARLSEKQQRVIGLKSTGVLIPKEKMHYFSFNRANPRTYALMRLVAETSFFMTRGKWRAKRIVKDVLRQYMGIKIKPKIAVQEKE